MRDDEDLMKTNPEKMSETLSKHLVPPYCDTWGTKGIWQINFSLDAEQNIAKMNPALNPALNPEQIATAALRMKKLGKDWSGFAQTFWTVLPTLLSHRIPSNVTVEKIRSELNYQLADEIYLNCHNTWKAAFLRGVLQDKDVQEHLVKAISNHSRETL